MDSLNPEQREAVSTTEGRLLVLAGAGTGKTKVIIHRIAHLIASKGVNPKAILGLTFTNKAAEEMRSRLAGILGKEAKHVTLCTFHSFCMQVLRKEIHRLGYTKDFSLYDEKDVSRLTQEIARDLLKIEGELPSLSTTIAAINAAKSKGEKITAKSDNKWHDTFSSDLFQRMQNSMRAYNAVDFDSLITLTLELFQGYPEVLEKYQERFRYFLIDEYQDTNPAQFKLAELLSSKYRNLCVVGDDDQSIYGWRGSEVKNILSFAADKIIKLQQNYRSTPLILEAANQVIGKNENRHKKSLWSSKARGELLDVFNAPSEVDEAQAVVDRILFSTLEKNIPLNEIAVLYRSNALSRNIELALMEKSFFYDGAWRRGIPYEIYGGLEFTERSEIKDLSAYLRTIANPLDQEAMLRIINVPRRGISDKTLDELTAYNRKNNLSLWELLNTIESKNLPLPSKAIASIKEFVKLVTTAQSRFQSQPLHQALLWFLQEIDYQKAIKDEAKTDKMQAFKWENVNEFVNSIAKYEDELIADGKKEEVSLQDFASKSLLGANKPSFSSSHHAGKVQLMTFHSAKGLEFDTVFLIGLEDHIVPHEKGIMETGIEEERRLLYVAMTRAKKKLTLSMARSRPKLGKPIATTPSRFLFEIPNTHYQVVAWDKINN